MCRVPPLIQCNYRAGNCLDLIEWSRSECPINLSPCLSRYFTDEMMWTAESMASYGRPYDSKDGPLCFAADVSLLFFKRLISKVPWPIATITFPHKCNLRNWVRNLGPLILKIWSPKHENLGSDFEQLPTWRWITSEWNKISSIRKGVENYKHSISGSVVLCPITKNLLTVVLTNPI